MNCKPFIDTYNNKVDQSITRIHRFMSHKYPRQSVLFFFSLYVTIVLVFSDYLKISCNYFVLLPLTVSAIVYGLPGGIIAGLLALPLNLLLFFIQDHLEYRPDNLYIAFCFGAFVGLVLGYLSDYFRKLINEVDRRIESENHLIDLLSEKDLLLREINHRVRNNLGIINSLIQLQANRVDNQDFRIECGKLKQRVFSISLVYEQLYMDHQALVLDLRFYLESLVSNILNATNELDISFQYNKPDQEILIGSDKVLHLGLIVQEIVINSIKYAFSETRKGQLQIDLSTIDGYVLIVVRDSGKGFDPDLVNPGLGSRLIESLSSNLGCEYGWSSVEGCVFTMKLVLPEN